MEMTISQVQTFLGSEEQIPGLDVRTVGDFWRWAYSGVLFNENCAILAECAIGVSLGVVVGLRPEPWALALGLPWPCNL